MPSETQHLQQLYWNQELIVHLTNGTPAKREVINQWIVVVQFYTAIHWIESKFALKKVHSPTHSFRHKLMEATWKKQTVALDAYDDLEQLANRARYQCRVPSPKDMQDATADLEQIISTIV